MRKQDSSSRSARIRHETQGLEDDSDVFGYKWVTIVIIHIRVLITSPITTHEPPSRQTESLKEMEVCFTYKGDACRRRAACQQRGLRASCRLGLGFTLEAFRV